MSDLLSLRRTSPYEKISALYEILDRIYKTGQYYELKSQLRQALDNANKYISPDFQAVLDHPFAVRRCLLGLKEVFDAWTEYNPLITFRPTTDSEILLYLDLERLLTHGYIGDQKIILTKLGLSFQPLNNPSQSLKLIRARINSESHRYQAYSNPTITDYMLCQFSYHQFEQDTSCNLLSTKAILQIPAAVYRLENRYGLPLTGVRNDFLTNYRRKVGLGHLTEPVTEGKGPRGQVLLAAWKGDAETINTIVAQTANCIGMILQGAARANNRQLLDEWLPKARRHHRLYPDKHAFDFSWSSSERYMGKGAVQGGHLNLLIESMNLEARVNPGTRAQINGHLMKVAVKANQIEIFRYLLEREYLNFVPWVELVKYRRPEIQDICRFVGLINVFDLFKIAAGRHDLELLKECLSDPDIATRFGQSQWMSLSDNNYVEGAQEVVKMGIRSIFEAEIELPVYLRKIGPGNNCFFTIMALRSDHVEIIKYYLDNLADEVLPDNMSGLIKNLETYEAIKITELMLDHPVTRDKIDHGMMWMVLMEYRSVESREYRIRISEALLGHGYRPTIVFHYSGYSYVNVIKVVIGSIVTGDQEAPGIIYNYIKRSGETISLYEYGQLDSHLKANDHVNDENRAKYLKMFGEFVGDADSDLD